MHAQVQATRANYAAQQAQKPAAPKPAGKPNVTPRGARPGKAANRVAARKAGGAMHNFPLPRFSPTGGISPLYGKTVNGYKIDSKGNAIPKDSYYVAARPHVVNTWNDFDKSSRGLQQFVNAEFK